MVHTDFNLDNRNKTIDMFLGDLTNYRKRDRKFLVEGDGGLGLSGLIGYCRTSPPYPKKLKEVSKDNPDWYGFHPRLATRLILFPKYLLLLTEWTPEKAEATKKNTVGNVAKFIGKSVLSEVTFGVSEITEFAVSKVTNAIPAESLKLLGKNPEGMLVNPWTWIINIEDIVDYRLEKTTVTLHYLYLHVNHRFEGEMDIGLTYQADNKNWYKADSLYKKLSKLIGK